MPLIKPTAARHDVFGFLAVLAAVAVGYVVSDRLGPPLAHVLLGPLLEGTALSDMLKVRWENLLALLLGIAFTLPLAAWAARKARFETLLGGLASYFSQPGAAAFLALFDCRCPTRCHSSGSSFRASSLAEAS